ncbi:unnamed protein product [Albugo candida]|nr:unnamed protein product [Albugo candida]|eukprot:CCI42391.1 unnamed protein product [Albugo candida]
MLLEQRRREDTSSVAPIECKNRESLDENYLDSSTGRKQRADSVVLDEKGLSGFLDYKTLDGTWQPLLFQTYGFCLTVYRSHKCPPQSPILVTDLRRAKEIDIMDSDAKQIHLRTEDGLVILRAVTEEVARFWVEGLQHLQRGIALKICHERTTFESEDDLYEQIDTLASSRLSHVRTDLSKSQLRMEKENFMCGMRGTSICYSANQRTIMKAHSDLNALRKDEDTQKCGCNIS